MGADAIVPSGWRGGARLHCSLALGLPQRSEQRGARPPPGEQAVQEGGGASAEGRRGKREVGEHHTKMEDRRWRID